MKPNLLSQKLYIFASGLQVETGNMDLAFFVVFVSLGADLGLGFNAACCGTIGLNVDVDKHTVSESVWCK